MEEARARRATIQHHQAGGGYEDAQAGKGWTEVRRRRNMSQAYVPKGSAHLSNIAFNIFVSNLPAGWSSSHLWNAVKHLGLLVDAYVPGKRDRGGVTFGFVRFARVKDTSVLLRSLNEMVLDGRRIIANVARYGRKGDREKAVFRKM